MVTPSTVLTPSCASATPFMMKKVPTSTPDSAAALAFSTLESVMVKLPPDASSSAVCPAYFHMAEITLSFASSLRVAHAGLEVTAFSYFR